MRDDPSQFVGSIPEFYERGLGPVLFAGPAQYSAERVRALQPARVLETAAGTGIVTERLRSLLPEKVEIVSTDLNEAMLQVARRKFSDAPGLRIEPADATALPYGDGAFDVVVCQFGIMFFPDKVRGLREARRVLAPGGRLVFSVWDSHEFNAFAQIADGAVRKAFPVDAPPFMQVPFSYARLDAIKADLLASGFGDFRADLVRQNANIADFDAFADGFVYGSPVAEQLRMRGGEPEDVKQAVLSQFRAEFGAGTITLHFLVVEAAPT